jgi:hypothetical protein
LREAMGSGAFMRGARYGFADYRRSTMQLPTRAAAPIANSANGLGHLVNILLCGAFAESSACDPRSNACKASRSSN